MISLGQFHHWWRRFNHTLEWPMHSFSFRLHSSFFALSSGQLSIDYRTPINTIVPDPFFWSLSGASSPFPSTRRTTRDIRYGRGEIIDWLLIFSIDNPDDYRRRCQPVSKPLPSTKIRAALPLSSSQVWIMWRYGCWRLFIDLSIEYSGLRLDCT